MRNFDKNLKLVLLLIPLLVGSVAYGQRTDVRGTILDGDNGNEPLFGAGVTIPGSTRGTTTDNRGGFSIIASPDETIVFSYLGYEEITMLASDVLRNPVIIMNEEAEQVDEIVVVGYGIQSRKSTLAAITQTKGEELLKGGNINSVGEALQGRLNGVASINQNGMPGGNEAQIFIRGKSSWVDGSKPLILVDGIERDFNDVDMNEIETISVLKDASATAVYGVRGGNGVILLTSKQGSTSAAKINFTSNFGFKQPTAKLDWADYPTSQFLWNEAVTNDGAWNTYIPESTIEAWKHAFETGNYGPYNDYFPDVDWYDVIMKKVGYSQNYNVNVSGGSDFMKYFTSLGYLYDGDTYNFEKQPTYDPRYYYQRYNWRSNFDFKLTNTTQFYISISGNMGYQNRGYGENVFTATLNSPSNEFPVKYSDGQWGETEQNWLNIMANGNTRGSQVYKNLKSYYDAKLTQQLDFITKGLSATAQLSYNTYSRTRSNIAVANVLGNNDGVNVRTLSSIRYYRSYDYSNPIVGENGTITYPVKSESRRNDDENPPGWPAFGNYDVLVNYNRRLYYEFAVNYGRSFGNHNVTAMAVFNRQEYEEMYTVNNNSRFMEFPNYREDWVARVTYNWKEKYLFEANMSYTGSEMFAPEKRFGFFPSFSAGWRLTEENFMKNFKNVLTNFKIRYTWGKSGSHTVPSDAPKYNYIGVYDNVNNINLGENSNNSYGPLYREKYAPDPNSSWETATKQNLGIEMSWWNKLRVDLELYDEKREGIMMKLRTAASWFGTEFPYVNLGKTKNHGIEVQASWNDRIGKNFNYYVNFSFSGSENRIIFKDDPAGYDEHMKDAGKPIAWQSRYIASGNYQTIDDIFNYSQSGVVAPTVMIPGDLVYMDYNGDGVIDANDSVIVKELNYPQRTYSMTLGFDWKGIGFSALIYSPQGVYKNTFDQFYLDFPSNMIKAQPWGMDRWTKETANTTGVKRPAVHTSSLQTHNSSASTYRYSNYSYIRLKTVELSYNFPKKLLSKMNMSNMRVYIAGNNLITISDVDKRVDPETSGAGQYPIVRSYTIGLRLSF